MEHEDHPPLADGSDWDQRYAGSDNLWSGNPNDALVAEVEDLPPGRALDVGCGEGADAIWLATRGWNVTAIDVSGVALERADAAARQREVAVRWVHAGLLEADLARRGFELVSAQYPPLLRTPDGAAVGALLDAVAVDGILLFVHHAEFGRHDAAEHHFDPAAYVGVEDVRAALDDDWKVEVDEQRPRQVHSGAGAGHVNDVVLRARRHR